MQIGHPSIANILCEFNFDWIAVDLEHAPIGIETAANLADIIFRSGKTPVVRIPANDLIWIRRCMDAGFKGIVVPMVGRPATAMEAMDAAYYSPKGSRGYGFCQANQFGINFNEYSSKANSETFIVAQIETSCGIDFLDTILKTGIDATFIGPYDLSSYYGKSGNFKNKKYLEAIDSYKKVSKELNVSTGTHIVIPNEDDLKEKIKEGYRFIAYGMDTTYLTSNLKDLKF